MYYSKNKICLSTFEQFADKYYCPDCQAEIKYDVDGNFKCCCGFTANFIKISNLPKDLRYALKKIKQEKNVTINTLKAASQALNSAGDSEKSKELAAITCNIIKNENTINANKLIGVMLLKEAADRAAASDLIEVNTLGFQLSNLIARIEETSWDF